MTLTQYPALAESVIRETLPGGLRLAVVPRKGFSKKVCYLAVNFGSIHTRFTLDGQSLRVPDGTAHYLEHKLFDMPDGRDITAELERLGANVNAFTSYDMTAYYFSCTENFAQCLRILTEFVFTPYFTQASIEKERGIIDQEIDMNLDTPDSVQFDRLMEALYAAHPVRVPILGTHETIRRITPETLYDCHRAFYTPENCFLCIVGDVDAAQAAAVAGEISGRFARPTAQKEPMPAEAMTAAAPRTSVKMDIAMPSFALGFKCEPHDEGEAAMRQELVAELAAEVLFGESSELYAALYAQGVIDSSFGGGFESIDGCAMLLCSGDSEELETVRSAVLAQAQKLTREGLDRDYFARCKRSALGRRVKVLDSFDVTCFRLCAYRFCGYDYFLFPPLYPQIGEAEVLDFIAHTVTPERCALSVINPSGTQEGAAHESE